jgi:hypothetical protein
VQIIKVETGAVKTLFRTLFIASSDTFLEAEPRVAAALVNRTTKSGATLERITPPLFEHSLSSQSIPTINCDRSTEQLNADQPQSEAWQLH